MAVIESKRSLRLTQPTKPSPANHRASTRAITNRATTNRKASKQKTGKRTLRLPASLRPVITKRGKTTIRRYPGRSFHRFEEAKGKPIDYIEFFTAGEYHSIDISFEDKTAVHFVIEPTFNLETEYADWKTGNWRPIKQWPSIRAAGLNS
jgi:hypothetical protein